MGKKPAEITSTIVDLLEPLESSERQRIIVAAMTLLGESQVSPVAEKPSETERPADGLPSKARAWAKQNGVSSEMLDEVFHIRDGVAEIIAEPPGKTQKDKTLNAYVLTGIAKFVSTGEPNFSDQEARDFCMTSGCYGSTNHATYLKDRGNDFSGNRDTGWSLTSPGLKKGAALIKTLAQPSE